MKRFNQYISILFGVLLLASCDKEVTTPELDANKVVVPTISAPANNGTYVFSPLNAKDSIKFTFSKASFPISVAPEYIVEAALSGTDFQKKVIIGVTANTKVGFDIASFNKALLPLLGENPSFDAKKFDFRISARLSDYSFLYSSEKITLTITPYDNSEVAFAMWCPGSYQGWSPPSAPKVYSPDNDGIYQGYVNFVGTDIQFKFTKQPDWNPLNWGNGGVAGLTGSLIAGADNIKLPAAGYYQVNADINTLTYKLILTSWEIIGTATPKGWDGGTAMTYDAASKTWMWTGHLEAGEMKFRGTSDWSINYGGEAKDADPANFPSSKCKAGGGNIKVPAAGNYVITLDLSKQPYKYKFVAK